MARFFVRTFGVVAACAVVFVAAAGCGGSSDGSGASSASNADKAAVATVLTAAGNDFAAVHNRDYAQPRAWFTHAGSATADPLRSKLEKEAGYPGYVPQRGRTSVQVTRTALVSLAPKSAYVIVVAKQTSTSDNVGRNGNVAYTLSLDLIDGKWRISVDDTTGVFDFHQDFASPDEQAAIKAAEPAYQTVLEIGSYQFDTKFSAAAAALTGTARAKYLASKATLKTQLIRDHVLGQDPEVAVIGLERPGSADVTVLVPWSVEVHLDNRSLTVAKGGVTELSMSEVGGTWLIAAMRTVA